MILYYFLCFFASHKHFASSLCMALIFKKMLACHGYLLIILLCSLISNSIQQNKCVADVDKTSIPRKDKFRWAIVALAKPGKVEINMRNKLIAEKIGPYASKHNISVLFFSEKMFPTETIQQWRDTFKGIANVQYINTASRGFSLPERYGYKYMCKFFSLDLYDYLKDFDYYMRCDTDCYINVLKYDIMKWAEDENVGYGFSMRKLEAHKPTAETLPKWTDAYMKRCGVEPTAIMDVPLSTCFNFYNNWHIGRVSFFNRADVRHYLESVNASGNIQEHRWGDSTIQAYAVRLFMNEHEIKQVPEFTYVHGSHGNKVVSTFGDGSSTNVPQRLPNWKAKQ